MRGLESAKMPPCAPKDLDCQAREITRVGRERAANKVRKILGKLYEPHSVEEFVGGLSDYEDKIKQAPHPDSDAALRSKYYGRDSAAV